jgi:hypothetical protein
VTAAHSIVVAVSVGTFAGSIGCSDSKGNVYSVDADINGPGRLFVCSAHRVVALTSADRITATYPGFSGTTVASASEFSGVTAVSERRSMSGSGVSPSAAVTTSAGGLIVGAVAYAATPTFAPGCSMTAIGPVSAGTGSGMKVLVPLYRIATVGGTYAACGTLSTSRPWLAVVASHR